MFRWKVQVKSSSSKSSGSKKFVETMTIDDCNAALSPFKKKGDPAKSSLDVYILNIAINRVFLYEIWALTNFPL